MTVRVRVADGGNTVALWEVHPDHPGGEVFVTGTNVFEVARTPAVEARLRNGTFVLEEGEDPRIIDSSPVAVAAPLLPGLEPPAEAQSYPPVTDVKGLGKKAALNLAIAEVFDLGDLAALATDPDKQTMASWKDRLFYVSEQSGYSEEKLLGWAEQAVEIISGDS